jgi:HEAT repeat protein
MIPSIEELLLMINNSQSDIRVASAKLFLEQKLLEESKDELLERIGKSADENEIKAAKFAIWRKELDTSYEGLIKVLQTESDEIKMGTAAELLGEKGYKNAVLPLINVLIQTTSWTVRDGAALGLRELADQRALMPLEGLLKKMPNESTLVYALETLDCTEIFETLIWLAKTQPDNPMVCWSVFECIEKINIANLSNDILETCKYEINEAIYETDDDEKLETLERLLELMGFSP